MPNDEIALRILYIYEKYTICSIPFQQLENEFIVNSQ